MKRIDRFFIVLFVCVICLGVTIIAEEITLTTYYPAPYGTYEELKADKMAVGDTDMPDTSGVVRFEKRKKSDLESGDEKEGAMYYNSTDDEFKYHDGSDWQSFGGLEYVGVGTFYTTPTTNLWEDWNLSGNIPAGAKYVEITIETNSQANSPSAAGARKKGANVGRTLRLDGWAWVTMTVELDANRVIEIISVEEPGRKANFYVLGYWK